MNCGRFFSLNLQASRLTEGIAVFDYTDMPAYLGPKNAISPQYPVVLSITNRSVKFILQYCVYRYRDEGGFRFTYQPYAPEQTYSGRRLFHMEEVLIELPFNREDGDLASIIKKLYTTPFPILLSNDNEKDTPEITGEPTKRNTANYIQQLLNQRYETEANSLFPDYCRRDVQDISYSALPVWGLRDKRGFFNLRKRNPFGKKKKGSGTQFIKYDKFLRKLLLDFMFDLEHSDLFQNSTHYDTMYSSLMSDFFFSAIVRKSEFYFMRELVSKQSSRWLTAPADKTTAQSTAGSAPKTYNIYAEYFDRAEKRWLDCIQSASADRHFVFIPNWFQSESDDGGWWQTKVCKIVLRPVFRVRDDSWFVDPEEELRRVYFRLRADKRNASLQVADFNTQSSGQAQSSGKDSKAAILDNEVCNSHEFADLCGGNRFHELNFRKCRSSLWLFKRYDFADAFRLSFFPYSNTLYFIALALFTFFILYTPAALSYDTLLAADIWIKKFLVLTCIVLGCAAIWFKFRDKRERTKKSGVKSVKPRLYFVQVFSWLKRIVVLTLIYWIMTSSIDVLLKLALLVIILVAAAFFGEVFGTLTRYVHFAFPRLISSIAAAWLSIALSEDLFKAFFDSPWAWRPVILISIVVFVFVLYEVNKILPYVAFWKKIFRTLELLFIGFTLSLLVGLVVINFTGDRFLERSGYLPEFYRDQLLTGAHRPDSLAIHWNEIDLQRVLDEYTLAGCCEKGADTGTVSRIIQAFGAKPYEAEYLDRIRDVRTCAHFIPPVDSASVSEALCLPADSTLCKFLLMHENPALFRHLLRHVVHRAPISNAEHEITTIWSFGKEDNEEQLKPYEFFVLRDFLIQFSFIAMFIGIFIQLIFEEKNITES